MLLLLHQNNSKHDGKQQQHCGYGGVSLVSGGSNHILALRKAINGPPISLACEKDNHDLSIPNIGRTQRPAGRV